MKSQNITISKYKSTDSSYYPDRAVERLLIIAKQAEITDKEISSLRKDNNNYSLANLKADSIIEWKDKSIYNYKLVIQAHQIKDSLNTEIIKNDKADIKVLVKSVKKQAALKTIAASIGLIALGALIFK